MANAILLVSSKSAASEKVHSANPAPFGQQMTLLVKNQTKSALKDAQLFIRPLNYAENRIATASFYTDSQIAGPTIKTARRSDGSFAVDVPTFLPDQLVVLEFLGFYPTAFVLEFSSADIRSTKTIQPGECGLSIEKVTLPFDFYSLDAFSSAIQSNPALTINDVADPVGALAFEYALSLNCGRGLRDVRVPMSGKFSMCGREPMEVSATIRSAAEPKRP